MALIGFETFHLGIRNILLHKMRSYLTVLGIIFGVAAVICMLSVSEGASADELRAIQLLGTKNIILNSVAPKQTTSASQGNTSVSEYGLRYADVKRIEASVPYLEQIVCLREVSEASRYKDRKSGAPVVGVEPGFFNAVNIGVSIGRLITDQDMEERLPICVIGADVARELFTYEDPLGESVLVERYPSSIPFTVVGVLEDVQVAGAPERGVEERNLNREIFIPYSASNALFGETRIKRSSGSREFTKVQVSGLYITVKDLDHVLPVSQMIKRILEFGHEQLDYDMKVPLAKLKIAEKKKKNSQIVLGFIAAISLLVGGIGIMNIMLATVTERTREIGVRRALGAKRRHITVQFLVETVVLSTSGGIIGVLLGLIGSEILSHLADWEPIVQGWAVGISFGLSVVVGIFFGMYPAYQAAQLDPIEALRHI